VKIKAAGAGAGADRAAGGGGGGGGGHGGGITSRYAQPFSGHLARWQSLHLPVLLFMSHCFAEDLPWTCLRLQQSQRRNLLHCNNGVSKCKTARSQRHAPVCPHHRSPKYLCETGTGCERGRVEDCLYGTFFGTYRCRSVPIGYPGKHVAAGTGQWCLQQGQKNAIRSGRKTASEAEMGDILLLSVRTVVCTSPLPSVQCGRTVH
jgi:hypothetical protein